MNKKPCGYNSAWDFKDGWPPEGKGSHPSVNPSLNLINCSSPLTHSPKERFHLPIQNPSKFTEIFFIYTDLMTSRLIRKSIVTDPRIHYIIGEFFLLVGFYKVNQLSCSLFI